LTDPSAKTKPLLVRSPVEKEEKTGRTHLKISLESEETVRNVLNMPGNLLKGLGK
jgi:hypothetical protein